LKKRDIVQLHIDDLAFGGRGVAKYENKIVFVDGALPGDTVDALIAKIKPNYCESKTVRIIESSPHRINPVCQHFDICGGCKWQNYEYDMQLKYKSDQLREHLKRIGGIEGPTVKPIIAARKTYFYRNKMEFSFHEGRDNELLLGLHYENSFDRIFDLERCHLESETSNEIVKFVRNECLRLELPPYHIRDHTGLMRFLVIREGKFTDEILVNIVTGDQYDDFAERIIELGQNIAGRLGNVKSVIWSINSKKANIAKADKYPPMLKKGLVQGRDHIYEKLNQYKYKISAGSFFQTNSYQAQLLYDTIIEYADFNKNDVVGDLYCGTGTIAIYISALVKSVVGVESVVESINDANINAELNGVKNIKFILSKVEELNGDLKDFNKLVIDPPRAGIHPRALRKIIEAAPEMVIYVSCNPSTLARDASELIKNGYILEKSVPIDMFPQTYHIESVSKFMRV
jgi:23S rRNA (uracil1939-C5)-methyltransferase